MPLGASSRRSSRRNQGGPAVAVPGDGLRELKAFLPPRRQRAVSRRRRHRTVQRAPRRSPGEEGARGGDEREHAQAHEGAAIQLRRQGQQRDDPVERSRPQLVGEMSSRWALTGHRESPRIRNRFPAPPPVFQCLGFVSRVHRGAVRPSAPPLQAHGDQANGCRQRQDSGRQLQDLPLEGTPLAPRLASHRPTADHLFSAMRSATSLASAPAATSRAFVARRAGSAFGLSARRLAVRSKPASTRP
jgi:hypothetical protein